jgi:hypothetical protein
MIVGAKRPATDPSSYQPKSWLIANQENLREKIKEEYQGEVDSRDPSLGPPAPQEKSLNSKVITTEGH